MPLPLVHKPSRLARLALLAALGLGLAPAALPAQGTVGIFYYRQRSFAIPFYFDPGERQVRQVLLHVSEDYGKTYQHVANAAPADGKFQFTARHDGWYWFTVQTQRLDGRLFPTNLYTVQPGLKVYVDTQPPEVTLRAVQPQEGTVAVEWAVKDDTLDLLTLKLDYRLAGSKGGWIALNVQQLARAQFGWTPAVNGPCEVRLRVSDRAQNQAEALATVTPVPGARPGPGGAAGGARVVHVRSRTFQLNYAIENVGPSNVKNVEVWMTRDTRSWSKYADDAKATGPYTLTVRAEGRWGFTLIPRSGVGLAQKPPEVGQQPQIWIEVDETKPAVRLLGVKVGQGAEAGKLTITWKADDRFLQAQPITIKYATAATGPWTEMRGKLENTGTYTHATEGLPYEFYVLVEAVDEAGNVGTDQTRETVKVDLKIPRIEKLEVLAGEAPPKPPE
jgi:hypothetical protein